MAVTVVSNRVAFQGNSLKLILFTGLVERHLRTVPRTLELETQGEQLIARNFEDEALAEFVKAVCGWGGYAGVWARVLRGNDLQFVRARFQTAIDALGSAGPDFARALEEVTRVYGLSVSFGSKHLRFLRPDICPVLDSVIGGGLDYPESSYGYHLYATDCQKVADALMSKGIENPCRRKGSRWFVGDVDMALFAFLQGF